LIFLLFAFGPFSLFAQYEGSVWYFGYGAGMDFYTGMPRALADGAMNAPAGCAAISNPDGQIRFYSDGQTVYNRKRRLMKNGDGLAGSRHAAQTALAVPVPTFPDRYLLFTVAAGGGPLYYSLVDMSAETGDGAVVEKNILLRSMVCEKITAARHQNGRDVWLAVHDWDSDAFVVYLITPSGLVEPPVVSRVGAVHSGLPRNASGCMKISPNGKWLACAVEKMNRLELFRFDPATGVVSDPLTFPEVWNAYGVEFSPDNTRLYVTSDRFGQLSRDYYLYQADLTRPWPTGVYYSLSVVAQYSDSYFSPEYKQGALQIGPDEKIYCARNTSSHLGVIERPNALGTACDYRPDGFFLGGPKSGLGLPAFIQSYYLPPAADFAFRDGACEGDSVLFVGRSSLQPDAWTWDFDDGAGATGQSRVHAFARAGVYRVKLTVSRAGQQANAVKTVRVFPRPRNPFGADTLVSCEPFFALDAQNSGARYEWSNGRTARTISVYASGRYSVKIVHASCEEIFSVYVRFLPAPRPRLGGDTTICADQYRLDAGDAERYLWNTGDTTRTLVVTRSGTYSVIAVAGICSTTAAVGVRINPDFRIRGDTADVCPPEPVELYGGTAAAYLWEPGGQTSAKIRVSQAGVYRLTAVSPEGCVQSDSFLVEDRCPFVVLPEAFSPNGDGLNDVLFPLVRELGPRRLTLEIFDRHGRRIFYGDDAHTGWDGTENRRPCSEGTYVYRLRAEGMLRGRPHLTDVTGTVTLLR
jgi:gliding motility-associated-like protein